MIPLVSNSQYLADRRSYERDHAEEAALFAAKRAVNCGEIGEALVLALQQLCRSARFSIGDHAILLAHRAAAIAHNDRQGDAA